MLKMPTAIKASKSAGKKPDFTWNHILAMHACAGPVLNEGLTELFARASYRSNVALGVATFEWLLRRFEGMTEAKEGSQLLEAGWATNINAYYFTNDDIYDLFPIGISDYNHGLFGKKLPKDDPLRLAKRLLFRDLLADTSRYGGFGIENRCTTLAVLANHIIPKHYAAWLEPTLRKTIAKFPRDQKNKKKDYFNLVAEPIVPREFFFDESFQYTQAAAKKVLQAFLNTLDPEENPYLQTAEEMKQDGYSRKPYKIEDLKKG